MATGARCSSPSACATRVWRTSPWRPNCSRWVEALSAEDCGLYRAAGTYTPVPGDLIFYTYGDTADHMGLVAELIPATEDTPAQLKTIEGNSNDCVKYVSIDLTDPRILGYGILPRQLLYCGYEGHVHRDACYDGGGNLMCTGEEHAHTEACEVAPVAVVTEDGQTELTFTGPDYRICVQYGSEASLPEGVTLLAREVLPETEEYQSYYDQAAAEAGTLTFARFFDVRFLLNGEPVEPVGPVSVTITYDGAVATGDSSGCQAIHFTEDGPELLPVETGIEDGGATSFTHIQDSFSVVGDLVTASESDSNTVSHSVTFKVMIDGQWQTVGSLPYYYTGAVDGSTRAYITSGMAAQILGPYGYTATTDPGYQFGYSYNDIYEIYYDQSNFCMDIPSGNIVNSASIQLYEANHTDAQTFRIWEAEEGYYYITPVTNSGLCVNNWGADTSDGGQILLYSTIDNDKASEWKIVSERNGTVSFWAANKPDSACIDLDGGTLANGTKIHIWNGSGNRFWRLEQQYRITNDGVSEATDGGMYKIGLTAESNGDIVCYYLPAETSGRYTNVAESAISTGNTLWSVSVRDDTHSVYSESELSNMAQYVHNGGEATVTVKNADGVLWSCVGATDVTSAQSGNNTIFTIRNITRAVEIVATKANPEFTVQYYANIDRYVLGSSGALDIINTSGAKLPQNTSEQSLLWLDLENTGTATDQNAGNQTSLYRVKSEKRLTQIYTDGTFKFEQHPGLKYFDKLWEQSNYKLDAVLVLKDGKSSDSTNDDDWWWYQINQTTWSNITFTNLASEENAPRQEGVKQGRDGSYCILLQEGTVLRLRYETNDQEYTNRASFHDYDITSGMNQDGTWRSGTTGINIPSNYTGGYATTNVAGVFAFGNANCETGLGLAQWKGNNINAYNGTTVWLENKTQASYGNNAYRGCTFGLVTGLDELGNLIWDGSIKAPNLFDDGSANGKHTYSNGSLQFKQTGDTYTLTAANSTVGTRDDLEYFFNPSPSSSTTHTSIFTNNFWPMDSAMSKTDPLMGAYNEAYNQCDIQVNGFWDAQNQVGGAHNGVNIPWSDDGRAHNWFFGMNFAISFTLTEDYLGPLEYIFFGDDDMWVFLDNKLICDIGGVHSSVGEYVNLRDYLPEGSSGQHTLRFFYTERGASGSTCWMSFTLPSVTSATTGVDTGSLAVSKTVASDGDYSDVEYRFRVDLLTAQGGSALNQTFSYALSTGEEITSYGTLKSGSTVTLKAGQTAEIHGIPAGTYYTVTELDHNGYTTTVNGQSGYILSGNIANGQATVASFVNTPHRELPETGGLGTGWYTTSGIVLMGAAALVYGKKRRRREAE